MTKIIPNIKDLNQFLTFVQNSKYKVTTFGGRRFYHVNDPKKDYSMNDLVFTLQTISKTQGKLGDCKKTLHNLSTDCSKLLNNKMKNANFFIRLISKIKRSIGNLFFDRKKVFKSLIVPRHSRQPFLPNETIGVTDGCLNIQIRKKLFENEMATQIFLNLKNVNTNSARSLSITLLNDEGFKIEPSKQQISDALITLLKNIKTEYLEKKMSNKDPLDLTDWTTWSTLKTLATTICTTKLPDEITNYPNRV